MNKFYHISHPSAVKVHKCCECHGGIYVGNTYEKTFLVDDDCYPQTFKICQHCEAARNWLLNKTDWPDDIDGDGHQYFYSMLREHLIEQAKEGDPKFSFRAYRFVVEMDRRRRKLADEYNAETVNRRWQANGK